MQEEDLKEFEGKNIKIVLNNNYQYNGEIISLSRDSLKFKDKYNAVILISLDHIKFVRENVKNDN